MVAEIQSWVSLFQSGESSTNPKNDDNAVSRASNASATEASKNSVSETKSEESAVTNSVVNVASATTVAATPPEVPALPNTPPTTVAKPAVVPVRGRARYPTYKKAVSTLSTTVASKNATTSTTAGKRLAAGPAHQVSVDRMIGTYVSVELTSGKKVLGVLQEKTAKEIKIQLPGMGPFSYAAETVKSIQPVD